VFQQKMCLVSSKTQCLEGLLDFFLTLSQIENDFKMCLSMLGTNENDTIKNLFPEFLFQKTFVVRAKKIIIWSLLEKIHCFEFI